MQINKSVFKQNRLVKLFLGIFFKNQIMIVTILKPYN